MSSLTAAVELLWPSLTKVRCVINLMVKHLGWGSAAALTVHFDRTFLPKALKHPIKSSVVMTTI